MPIDLSAGLAQPSIDLSAGLSSSSGIDLSAGPLPSTMRTRDSSLGVVRLHYARTSPPSGNASKVLLLAASRTTAPALCTTRAMDRRNFLVRRKR